MIKEAESGIMVAEGPHDCYSTVFSASFSFVAETSKRAQSRVYGGQRMKIVIYPSHPYRSKGLVHTSIFFR